VVAAEWNSATNVSRQKGELVAKSNKKSRHRAEVWKNLPERTAGLSHWGGEKKEKGREKKAQKRKSARDSTKKTKRMLFS